MKALVLATNYPSEKGHDLMYVHVRNKYYQENGIEVVVLNFKTDIDYEYDQIRVISKKSYKKNNEKFDVLISHASNIKNHYLFIKKYEKRFTKIIFFYHGHEILKINENYPASYFWIKN